MARRRCATAAQVLGALVGGLAPRRAAGGLASVNWRRLQSVLILAVAGAPFVVLLAWGGLHAWWGGLAAAGLACTGFFTGYWERGRW